MNDLTARVLNAIPAGAFEMNALLSLLRIEETDAVPTASVSCERRPVLRINPHFVRRQCRDRRNLFLLVMHEFHHVLLGHTRLFPLADTRPQPRVRRAHQFHARPALPRRSLPILLSRALWRPGRAGTVARPPGGVPRLRTNRCAASITCSTRTRRPHRRKSSTLSSTRSRAGKERIVGPTRSCWGRMRQDEDGGWGTEDRLTGRLSRRFGTSSRSGRRLNRRFAAGVSARALSRADITPDRPGAGRTCDRYGAHCSARPPTDGRAPRPSRSGRAGPGRRTERVRPPRSDCPQPRVPSRSSTGGRRRCARGRMARARVYIDVSGSMAPFVPFLYGALVALRRTSRARCSSSRPP